MTKNEEEYVKAMRLAKLNEPENTKVQYASYARFMVVKYGAVYHLLDYRNSDVHVVKNNIEAIQQYIDETIHEEMKNDPQT